MGWTALPLLCACGLIDPFETVEAWVERQRRRGVNDLLVVHHADVRFDSAAVLSALAVR